MSKKKMIIRNCPAILKMTKICDDYRTTRDNPQLCKDCTDCVLKQIVELCKQDCLAEKHLIHKSSTFYLGNEILQKLDIEDVENDS